MSENTSSRSKDKFDLWERKLLDLTTRNALLNVKMKGSTVPLLVTSSCSIEDDISDDKEYSVISRMEAGEKVTESGEKQPAIPAKEYELTDLADTESFSEVLVKGSEDKKIYSALPTQELEDRLKKLYRESRNALDEDGAGTLFLACGFLKWTDDKKESDCYAPIVLVPVELVRKFGVGRYVMRKIDDDAVVNITLLEKLKQDFDILVPELEGEVPPDEHGINVQGVFDTLKGALVSKPGWEIIDACVLGMFKFSQFVMWHDMHNYREQIASNKIVNSLIEGRLTWDYEDMEREGKGFSDESKVYLPISADSSQLYAIYKASHKDGDGNAVSSSFVLHGPPGTGKSQTITSIIANAVANGQKVLFAAEKKAALDVVYARLSRIGLAPFCLELHSNKVRKGYVLDQLKEAYEVRHNTVTDPDYEKAQADIRTRRGELNAYAGELSAVRPCGYTLYEMLNIYAENESAPDVLLENGFEEGLTEERINASVTALSEYLAAGRGLAGKLPYIKATEYSQDTKIKLGAELAAFKAAADKYEGAFNAVKASFPSLEGGADLASADRTAAKIDRFLGARTQILKTWSLEFLAQDASSLKASYEAAANKWGPLRGGALKKVYNIVKSYDKSGNAEPELGKHLDALLTYKNEFSAMGFDPAAVVPAVLGEFKQAHQEFDAARSAVVNRLGIKILEPGTTSADFNSVRSIIDDITANESSIRPKIILNGASAKCGALKLNALIEAFGKGVVNEDTLLPAFMKAWSKLLICRTIDEAEILRTFSGSIFDDKVKKLKSLSDEFESVTRQEICLKLAQRSMLPNIETANKDSALGKLQRAIKSHGRGISIRSLMREVSEVVLELTPCVLMSPMSAAQFIEPSSEPMFDLVIFDEASQLPTCKAVGVLARGKDAVVVGDPNQMPPTSFFKEQTFDDENYDVEDLESILDDCLAVGMPESRLLWHYRSRHESLITFSNRAFYDSKLYTFPSVDDITSRVNLVKCQGTFDSGKTRTNEVEARAVVDELVARSKDAVNSKLTHGIVTFNIQQQNLIEDMIDEVCRTDADFEKWAFGSEEPIFIKNLENVQGDERDVILFSVSYGPDPEGKVSMNFGPLNRDGGWRRLNVAVTRSRCEMKVFSSLEPEQIKVSEATPEGVKAFRRFLMYAEGNSLWCEDLKEAAASAETAHKTSTGIIDSMCVRLAQEGFETCKSVGKSGFKVDIGVRQKGSDSYCLGILIDGSASGSHTTATAREVSQPSILKGLGWNVIKIWSIDWWEDKDAVMKAILDKIREGEGLQAEEPEPAEAALQKAPADDNTAPEVPEQPAGDAKKNG
ncbi:MAG: DUF4011 domain-containing protein [Clostridiales bacterium]|nr:DUF4011 domain-containing protein [Clostridiales bacterium]